MATTDVQVTQKCFQIGEFEFEISNLMQWRLLTWERCAITGIVGQSATCMLHYRVFDSFYNSAGLGIAFASNNHWRSHQASTVGKCSHCSVGHDLTHHECGSLFIAAVHNLSTIFAKWHQCACWSNTLLTIPNNSPTDSTVLAWSMTYTASGLPLHHFPKNLPLPWGSWSL